jgi:hypothetical protein
VTWQATANDGTGERIFAQRFDSSAAPIGTILRVDTGGGSSAFTPDVVSNDVGDVVVAWTEAGLRDGEPDLDIVARRFDANMNPQGDPFQVNSYGQQFQDHANVAFGSTGEFVVTWKSFNPDGAAGSQDGTGRGVFARLFDLAAAPQGSELQVNSYTTGDQGGTVRNEVDITTDGDGRYVVVWSSHPPFGGIGQDGSRAGVFAQRFCVDPPLSRVCGDVTCLGAAITQAPLVSANDALALLRSVVGLDVCEPCVCDVNTSGTITATDALIVLRATVGLGVVLDCPPCD